MTRAKRTAPDKRRELILDAAIKLSVEIGYNKLTRDAIAERAKVSSALVSAYFSRMHTIKTAVMQAAIEREIVEIIAQGMTLNDPHALKIKNTTKQKVLSYLSQIT